MLRNGDGFTLISDRQKGLLRAVEQELPMIEHRMCARHIYGNLKRSFPNKRQFGSLFWAVSDSYNKADYEANLEKLKQYDYAVYEGLMMRNPINCSRAFFKTTCCCEDALNNFSESYNSTIEKARALPLVEMLETMRRQAMARIEQRLAKSMKHKGKYTPKVAKMIALEEKERKWCKRFPGPNGLHEVSEKGIAHTVNMLMRTCSCRMWDVTGIPCRNVLRVITDKKYEAEDYISNWYLTTTWQQQYTDSIKPMEGLKFWKESGEPRIQAPPPDNSKGRKKLPAKRIKGIYESPTKRKKVTKHARIMHCYRCGLAGHNSTSCTNGGVPYKPKPKKKTKNQISHVSQASTQDDGEGPSEPSQTSSVNG